MVLHKELILGGVGVRAITVAVVLIPSASGADFFQASSTPRAIIRVYTVEARRHFKSQNKRPWPHLRAHLRKAGGYETSSVREYSRLKANDPPSLWVHSAHWRAVGTAASLAHGPLMGLQLPPANVVAVANLGDSGHGW